MFGNRHLLTRRVPGVSGDAPFGIVLDQQVAAHVMVHFRPVLHQLGCGQDYRHIAEDEDLHSERALFEGAQRTLSHAIHAFNEGIQGLRLCWPCRWKERSIRQEIGRKSYPIWRSDRRPLQALEVSTDQGPNCILIAGVFTNVPIDASEMVQRNARS